MNQRIILWIVGVVEHLSGQSAVLHAVLALPFDVTKIQIYCEPCNLHSKARSIYENVVYL